ncbi:MAG: hypothetical protein SGI71_11320 [Verrucomicrobiota bacterium]|nr:hypothetical protein [Verrucomicrobiota bacterium]
MERLLVVVTGTVNPDNTTATNLYLPTGELSRTWGSRVYPVDYTYENQGRLKTLTTYRDFVGNAGKDVTTWNYATNSSRLASKVYADGKSVGYTYTDGGRVLTRKWVRNLTTSYEYHPDGMMKTTSYSDSTPAVSMGYTREGWVKTMTGGAESGTTSLEYNEFGQSVSESVSGTGALLSGVGLIRGYDSMQRASTFKAQLGAVVL